MELAIVYCVTTNAAEKNVVGFCWWTERETNRVPPKMEMKLRIMKEALDNVGSLFVESCCLEKMAHMWA